MKDFKITVDISAPDDWTEYLIEKEVFRVLGGSSEIEALYVVAVEELA